MEKADERPGVANIVTKHLVTAVRHMCNRSDADLHLPRWTIDALVTLAIYGPIHNKAHRSVVSALVY